MGEDAESDLDIRFVEENDYREIPAKAVSAKRKLKKNRPSWLVSSIVTTLIREKLIVLAKKMKSQCKRGGSYNRNEECQ